jgi:nitroreductase
MRRHILVGGALALAGGASYAGLRRMGSMKDYERSVAAMRASLSAHPEVGDLIRFATLAPNGHNTQPWTFHVAGNQIEISPDFARRTPVVDPDDHHIFVGLGCAAENLALAASARGHPGEISFTSANDGVVVFSFGGGATASTALFDAIPRRQSTRTVYDGRPVAVAELKALAAAAAIPGVDLVLLTDRARIDHARDLVIAGNSAQMGDPAFDRELMSWLRFNPRQALATGDGLFTPTTGNPVLPSWLGPSLVGMSFRASSENDKYARQLQSSSGVAVFVSERADKEHWVRAGRACQRFALQATALGMKVAFVNQPVEVASLRPELAALVGMPGRRPDLVMRFGYGPTMPFSARRPVGAVLA